MLTVLISLVRWGIGLYLAWFIISGFEKGGERFVVASLTFFAVLFAHKLFKAQNKLEEVKKTIDDMRLESIKENIKKINE